MMSPPPESSVPPAAQQRALENEDQLLRRFQARADEICRLIINTDLPWVDIAIQIEQLRWEAERLFPQKAHLFEMIYVSRFKRLWQQWRQSE